MQLDANCLKKKNLPLFSQKGVVAETIQKKQPLENREHFGNEKMGVIKTQS
jgi:hypothetical protein